MFARIAFVLCMFVVLASSAEVDLKAPGATCCATPAWSELVKYPAAKAGQIIEVQGQILGQESLCSISMKGQEGQKCEASVSSGGLNQKFVQYKLISTPGAALNCKVQVTAHCSATVKDRLVQRPSSKLIQVFRQL